MGTGMSPIFGRGNSGTLAHSSAAMPTSQTSPATAARPARRCTKRGRASTIGGVAWARGWPRRRSGGRCRPAPHRGGRQRCVPPPATSASPRARPARRRSAPRPGSEPDRPSGGLGRDGAGSAASVRDRRGGRAGCPVDAKGAERVAADGGDPPGHGPPGAQRRHAPVRCGDGVARRVGPGGRRQLGGQPATIAGPPGAGTSRSSASSRSRAAVLTARTARSTAARRVLTTSARRASSWSRPVPVTRGDRQDGDVVESVGSEDVGELGQAGVELGGGEQVDLVEHHEERRVLAGEIAKVRMDRGIAVLLRVGHPEQEIGQVGEPLHLELVRPFDRVVVGQVDQDQAVERVLGAGERPASARDGPGGSRASAAAVRRRVPTRPPSQRRWWVGAVPASTARRRPER